MKKVPLILASVFLCAGCTNTDIPVAIRDFVNGINFNNITAHLRSGVFSQTYEEVLNKEVSGKNSIEFAFSSKEDEMNYHAVYTFEGNQVKDNITSKEVTLTYEGPENYKYEVKTNLETTSEVLNYEKAHEKFYKIFDSGVNPYRFGGLYYGDYFAINMNKFYKLYFLSNDGKTLSLKENNASYYEQLTLSQQIDIDVNGMLLYKKEFAKDANSVNTGTLIQNASYIYN